MKQTSPVIQGLSLIHKIITRGLTISIQKCDEYLRKEGIPTEEATGFLLYVKTLKLATHSHHLSEDEIAFPYFRDYIEAPYSKLKDDHQTIALVLERLEKCLPQISSGRVGSLRETLGEFEKLWVPHIRIEEENFTTEKINKAVGMQEQVVIAQKLGRHGSKNSGPGPLALPFMFYNLEGKDREAFMMPFPWIVKKALVPVIWKGQWKPMSQFLLKID
jgi:hemerythrin-like domain-containing protein